MSFLGKLFGIESWGTKEGESSYRTWWSRGKGKGGWETTEKQGSIISHRAHHFDKSTGKSSVSGWNYNKNTGESQKFNK